MQSLLLKSLKSIQNHTYSGIIWDTFVFQANKVQISTFEISVDF